MTDKLTEEKIIIAEERKSFKNIMMFALISAVGIVIFVALYLHFEQTYKHPKLLEQPASFSSQQPEVKTLGVSGSNAVLLSPTQQDSIVTDNKSPNLMASYLKMRLKAEQGYAFNEELHLLIQQKNNSEEVKSALNELEPLALQNVNDSYFRDTFTGMIRQLYKNSRKASDNTLYNYLRKFMDKLFFIRAVDNRAIRLGGFDMNIALAERALAQNELVTASLYIGELPVQASYFKEFKQKLQVRIAIKNALVKLDNIYYKDKI